jgi:hypothetical protein
MGIISMKFKESFKTYFPMFPLIICGCIIAYAGWGVMSTQIPAGSLWYTMKNNIHNIALAFMITGFCITGIGIIGCVLIKKQNKPVVVNIGKHGENG